MRGNDLATDFPYSMNEITMICLAHVLVMQKYIGVMDARQCITAIWQGGYATSPTYISTIMNIINKNNLTQYDV